MKTETTPPRCILTALTNPIRREREPQPSAEDIAITAELARLRAAACEVAQ